MTPTPQQVAEARHLATDIVLARNKTEEERRVLLERLSELIAHRDEVERLLRANKALEIKNHSSLANNLCPDHRDKQQGKPCLACEAERLRKELSEFQEKIMPIECEWSMHLEIVAKLTTERDTLRTREAALMEENERQHASQQICVGAAGVGDFSELCGWIDAAKEKIKRLEKAGVELK